MSRAVDPRLLRAAPALRPFLLVVTAAQLLGALLIIAQAELLASILVGVFARDYGAELATRLVLLGGVGLARAALAAAQEYVSARASLRVRAQLRRSTLRSVVGLGPTWAQRQPAGRLVNSTGPGVDALDGYVTRALPALVAAAVIPGLVLTRIFFADWQSGLLFLGMLPLVPLFMALVGVTTKRRVERQYAQLARMAGHFLDLLRGLTTLTIYGQAARQERTLREATEQYRRQTMSALRVAFLSALVLDLIAALSVAVVAVDVGLRLDGASLSFTTALVVLLLAPELFAPLRAVGVQFHASQEGSTAAAAALDLIDEEAALVVDGAAVPVGAEPASTSGPGQGVGAVVLDRLTIRYPGRDRDALGDVDLQTRPGETIALLGRSGAGKSTVLAALLGLVAPVRGRILVRVADERVDLATVDGQSWRADIGWLPQRPRPTQPTVADEIRLGDPTADDAAVSAACRRCHAPAPTTRLGEDGGSVSAGQRRRIALARVLLRVDEVRRRGGMPIVLLDEPSEDLDHDAELVVAEVIRSLSGRATVVIATHSELLADLADRRITLEDGRLTAEVHREPAPRFEAPGRGTLGSDALNFEAGGFQARSGQTASITLSPSDRISPSIGSAPAALRLRDLARGEHLRARLLAAGALSALAGLAGLALTATSIWLISRAAQHPNVQALAIAVVGVRTFALARALLRYAERLTAHDVALRMLVGLRAQVFSALRPLGPSVLGGYRRGDLLRRFVGDVDGLLDGLVRAFVPLAGALVTGAGACAVVAGLVPRAGLVLGVALVFGAVIVPWLTTRAAGDADTLVGLAGRRDEGSNALVDGLAELTAYGAADGEVDRISAFDTDIGRRARRLALAASVGTGFGAATAAVTLPLVLALGASSVRDGGMSAVSLGVLAVCVLVGFEAVTPLPSAFAAWVRCRAGLARVTDVLAATPSFTEPDRPATPPVGASGVAVARVRLRPAPGAPTVLDGADLDIGPGRRVALTGPSGSGKSTLLAAVLRLRPADAGFVHVTGAGHPVDLVSLRAQDVPPLVAGSLQGDHVFDATLRDNLRVVRPGATDDELDVVAGRAGLTGFISTLPNGWSTLAGTDGSSLSGGQRQRLLLARALLADPHVLVLDEPTAHLDTETERAVLSDLLDATAGRTVLISTHRHLLGDQVDTLVRISGGQVVSQAVNPDRVVHA